MTVMGILPETTDRPTSASAPDRRILTRSELETLSAFLENFRDQYLTAEGLDIECAEEH